MPSFSSRYSLTLDQFSCIISGEFCVLATPLLVVPSEAKNLLFAWRPRESTGHENVYRRSAYVFPHASRVSLARPTFHGSRQRSRPHSSHGLEFLEQVRLQR